MPMKDIDHVVVLMLENRSFDHFLGDLSMKGGRKDVDGVAPGMSNPDPFGGTVTVQEVTKEKFLTDGGHAFEDVREQLAPVGDKTNQGFVTNYALRFKTAAKKKKLAPEIMRYQTPKTVPVIYALANEYALSDRWFCSVPSETWPNRVFTAAATTEGRLTNGLPLYKLPTLYSRLRDKNREWAVYNDQLPNVVNIRHMAGEFLRSRHKKDSRFRSMKQFEDDCAKDQLRPYSFIEPVYFFSGANDDHPPHDIINGQKLIAQVYLAIRRNEELWKKTVLIITDDEHGGFFDHVQPPKNVPAPKLPAGTKFDFKSLGPRVPFVLVTPWSSKQNVVRPPKDGFFDHTSIIRSVSMRFGLKALTPRDQGASDFWPALDLAKPRTDDADTFKKISEWLLFQQAAGVEEAVEEQTMVGLSGRSVAKLIATAGTLEAVEPKPVPETEFQRSMRELAAEIAASANELQAEA